MMNHLLWKNLPEALSALNIKWLAQLPAFLPQSYPQPV